MRMRQGNGRANPDGYLHLNNYSHTLRSGWAGVIYERMLTKQQQQTVESMLVSTAHAYTVAKRLETPLWHIKHDAYRFRKDFLDENFQRIVHIYAFAVKLNPKDTIGQMILNEFNSAVPEKSDQL